MDIVLSDDQSLDSVTKLGICLRDNIVFLPRWSKPRSLVSLANVDFPQRTYIFVTTEVNEETQTELFSVDWSDDTVPVSQAEGIDGVLENIIHTNKNDKAYVFMGGLVFMLLPEGVRPASEYSDLKYPALLIKGIETTFIYNDTTLYWVDGANYSGQDAMVLSCVKGADKYLFLGGHVYFLEFKLDMTWTLRAAQQIVHDLDPEHFKTIHKDKQYVFITTDEGVLVLLVEDCEFQLVKILQRHEGEWKRVGDTVFQGKQVVYKFE